jgi:DNA modification methylase
MESLGVQVTRKLAVTGQRLCTCSPNKLNCMDAKEWIKAQLGVWQVYYEGRDIRDKEVHPAVMPIALAKKAVELFTHKGELVVDPFNGIGTTLLACQDLERNAVGFDISERYRSISEERLAQQKMARTKQITITDDARNISEYLEPESVSLLFTSPPYANLLNRPRLNKSRRGKERKNEQFLKVEQYSQDSRDLGTLPVEQYAKQLGEIYRNLLPILRTNGHSVINVPDMWWSGGNGGKRIPIHIYVYHAMLEAGYELRNTIIWDRTNIVNRIGIFGWPSNYITMGTTFEYLLDFRKPQAQS